MIEAALVVTIAAFIWLTDRKDRRHQAEREALTQPPTEWLAVIENLCQRLQAPEHAIIEHQIANVPPSPPAVGFDDDEGFHEAQGLTKEKLAEMVAEAERAAAV